jgi:hypothetical protein
MSPANRAGAGTSPAGSALAGRVVVVTRARREASRLAAELERRGVRLTLRDAGPTIARFIAVAGARPDRLQI